MRVPGERPPQRVFLQPVTLVPCQEAGGDKSLPSFHFWVVQLAAGPCDGRCGDCCHETWTQSDVALSSAPRSPHLVIHPLCLPGDVLWYDHVQGGARVCPACEQPEDGKSFSWLFTR